MSMIYRMTHWFLRAFSEAAVEQRSDQPAGNSLENPRNPLSRIFQVEASASGKVITESSALGLTAVWRCISLISGVLARTPLLPYRRTEDGRELLRGHYLFPLLTAAFNPYMTAYRGKRLLQTWLLQHGNAYAEIEINGRGQVVALWPWRPDKVVITGVGPKMTYTYVMDDYTTVTLPAHYVLHLRGLETDGIRGLSPIQVAKQSLGLAAAAEEYGARYFSNNGRFGGWIEHPGALGKTAQQNLRETIESLHRGLAGSHRLGILEEGMKFHDVAQPSETMQFLDSRKFQTTDIARLYGVPPHKIGDMTQSTLNNIEHQSIEFVNDCMDDWFCNWECELANSLLSTRDLASIELRFYREGLMRGDLKTRSESFAIQRSWGVISANEWRQEEGKNKREDEFGDDYIMPLNYAKSGEGEPDPVDPENADDDESEPPEPTDEQDPAAQTQSTDEEPQGATT